jgi:two-component system nitrogen regulation response regulator GlnG
MPLDAQTRLLRVLQEGEFTRVGGREPISANVRIVAATHRDLRLLVRQGLFREDLFYRLNVVPVRLPPLTERREDIPELVNHFLQRAVEEGLPAKRLDASAMERLMAYDWPGNVRELENFVKRLTVLYSQEVIDGAVIEAELAEPSPTERSDGGIRSQSLGEAAEHHIARYFAAHGGALPGAGLYERVLREVERPLIALTLEATGGNQLQAARVLGLNRNTLRKKLRELDIPAGRGLK